MAMYVLVSQNLTDFQKYGRYLTADIHVRIDVKGKHLSGRTKSPR